MHLKTIMQKLY